MKECIAVLKDSPSLEELDDGETNGFLEHENLNLRAYSRVCCHLPNMQ